MPPLPNIFMPRSGPPSEPATPTSPQQRLSLEERKRAMVDVQPELYQNESRFGPIPGMPIGKTWSSRKDCSGDGMHTPTKAGISGGKDGAYSIVMSGGYVDDVDNGDEIMYTGTGGYGDERRYGGGSSGWGSGIQIEDQSFDHKDNNALLVSRELGKPVRVIRGCALNSKYAPRSGYRYDGIYKVIDAYMHKPRDGVYKVCRYKLRREPGQDPIPARWN